MVPNGERRGKPARLRYADRKADQFARERTRVTASDKETDNPKYAFRCFLLRLGFIGAEYKRERAILLRNLEGNGAFKSGRDSRKNPA